MERRFRADGTQITPDIVARDRDGQVLVTDFKHTTLPIELRQVSDRLKSFDADCDQMRRYQRMFSEHPEVLAAVGGGDHPGGRRFGLIYRWPLALPYPVASGVMVLQAEQIIRELNNGCADRSAIASASGDGEPCTSRQQRHTSGGVDFRDARSQVERLEGGQEANILPSLSNSRSGVAVRETPVSRLTPNPPPPPRDPAARSEQPGNRPPPIRPSVPDLPPIYGPGAVRVGSTVMDGSSGRRSEAESARGTIAPYSAGVRYPSEL